MRVSGDYTGSSNLGRLCRPGARALGCCICLVVLLGAVRAGGEPPRSMHHSRTNVLWLTICTLRADHLGAYGYPYDTSPAIDRLAGRGVLFERTLTPAPWTRPAIAAAITGLYPRSLNIDEPLNQFNRRKLHDSFRTLAEILHEKGYYTIGLTANPNTNAVFNFDQGYDHYEDTGNYVFWLSQQGERKRLAEQLNASLLEHLRGPARGKKFFAHLVYVDTHQPLLDRVIEGRFEELALELRNTPVPRYDRQIRYLDSQIAALLEQLAKLGLADTLVIITSDHGEAFGLVHPQDKWHGRALYNAALWVPFILYHPSLKDAVHRRPELVDLTCLQPTVLDLLGLEYELPQEGGKSLKGLIYGQPKGTPLACCVAETFFEEIHKSAIVWLGWKLIITYPPGENGVAAAAPPAYELYQFEKDRKESQDLASTRPYLVKKMLDLLADWRRSRPALVPAEELHVETGTHIFEDLKALGYIE